MRTQPVRDILNLVEEIRVHQKRDTYQMTSKRNVFLKLCHRAMSNNILSPQLNNIHKYKLELITIDYALLKTIHVQCALVPSVILFSTNSITRLCKLPRTKFGTRKVEGNVESSDAYAGLPNTKGRKRRLLRSGLGRVD
ncbi:hypothetical protein KQX54_021088 [Cotesia glomerata]|uniref:Uncharacterized protein n=1 Tax=Cotesia glomerata TaxID=32391 RepID=A0AAV7J6M1_COTGL|nr:hypothetical protein KQX54_021088 [Cotesia glomerata]